MNDRMEQEIRRTILRLQASMPEPRDRQTPVFTLLRIAAGEINGGLLLGLFAGALIFGLLSVRALSMPMLTIFCTAPMPMLLLFHRYVLASNQNMRELEATFPYSCTLLLFLSARLRNSEGLSLLALVFWAALCFLVTVLPFDRLLQLCSTAAYAVLAAIGLILYGILVYNVQRRREHYDMAHIG